jgi:hypothetical protein
VSGIFITYRRDDSQGFAGRLDADLTGRFGEELVFRDREIAPGERFGQRLLDSLTSSDVAVAVIAPRWISACDGDGNRRLDQPGDWVRLELETALERGIPIVPVLVGGARMPARDHLPASLADFAQRQAFPLSDLRWDREVDELALQLARLSPVLNQALDRRGVSRTADGIAVAIRDVGEQVIEEAMRRRHVARRPGLLHMIVSRLAHQTRRLIMGLALALLAYVVIRRAGGPELNAMLDQLIAVARDFLF